MHTLDATYGLNNLKFKLLLSVCNQAAVLTSQYCDCFCCRSFAAQLLQPEKACVRLNCISPELLTQGWFDQVDSACNSHARHGCG
jgi:hypothetical protein